MHHKPHPRSFGTDVRKPSAPPAAAPSRGRHGGLLLAATLSLFLWAVAQLGVRLLSGVFE